MRFYSTWALIAMLYAIDDQTAIKGGRWNR